MIIITVLLLLLLLLLLLFIYFGVKIYTYSIIDSVHIKFIGHNLKAS
jgi:hypothetical protein